MKTWRLDVWLVEAGFVPSRAKAQEMIREGAVEIFYGGSKVQQVTAHTVVDPVHPPSVTIDASYLRFVSRGGRKLEEALVRCRLDVSGQEALDVGASTGGFTDCLLQSGCARVVAIDVGRAQLASSLVKDPRVISFEKMDIRKVLQSPQVLKQLSPKVELAVIDVSFISLAHILPVIPRILPWPHRVLALVKPQFELGRRALNKQGIWSDLEGEQRVYQQVKSVFKGVCYEVSEFFPSSIRGQDGNQEYFMFGHYSPSDWMSEHQDKK